MSKKRNSQQSIIISFLIIISQTLLSQQECSRENPILKTSTCSKIYCSPEEFSTNICSISNSIIKTQWLTNIIPLGGSNYRYLNSVITSEGDLIILTTNYPITSERFFFGLKKNGHFYFNEKENESPFYSLYVPEENKERFEGNIWEIKINNDEYIFGISYGNYNAELYDFNKNLIYIKSIQELTGAFTIQLIPTFIEEKDSNGNYYYLLGINYQEKTISENDSDSFITHFYFQIEKIVFYSKDLSLSSSIEVTSPSPKIEIQPTKITSCYTTPLQKIICLIYSINYKLLIVEYNYDFSSNQYWWSE